MRILIVEDDKQIAAFILKGLKENGFEVDHALDGKDGLRLGLTGSFDLAIVDLMLPKLSGLEMIGEIRRNGIKTPIIVLSARGSVEDRVKGLHTGADDYLTKPFAFSELMARIQALLRRSQGAAEPTRLTIHDLTVDLLKHEAVRSGKKIELQPREFALLEYLMRNAGSVISKTTLMEQIWNYNFDPQTNIVDVLVCRVRNKIDRDFTDKLIHTIRGVGYVLKNT